MNSRAQEGVIFKKLELYNTRGADYLAGLKTKHHAARSFFVWIRDKLNITYRRGSIGAVALYTVI
jgi:hypothetical protein